MSNNMDLGYDMFCYQCEQTAGGKGCTKLGASMPDIFWIQDLMLTNLLSALLRIVFLPLLPMLISM